MGARTVPASATLSGRLQMIFKSSSSPSSDRSYEPEEHPRNATAKPARPANAPVVWTSLDKVQISGHFELTEDGELHIAGNVRGNIKCHALTISDHGSMKGDINADIVLIAGAFSGRIEARRLTLTNTARVRSEDVVVSEAVVIEEGTDFEGNLRRTTDKVRESDKAVPKRKNGGEAVIAPDSVPKEAVLE